MAKTEILMQRIGAKLHEIGLTEREASMAATGKPDAIRYIRTRNAMPAASRLQAIAKVLNTTPEWLLGEDGAIERTDAPPPVTPEALQKLARDLPIYGTALGAEYDFANLEGDLVAIEQTEINMAVVYDYAPRPTALAGKSEYYVVTVAGDSMSPRFDAGRRVLVNGKRLPSMGDDVIVQMVNGTGHDGGQEYSAILIKQLVRRKADTLVLKQFNPETIFEVPIAKVAAVHKIVPWDEALGL